MENTEKSKEETESSLIYHWERTTVDRHLSPHLEAKVCHGSEGAPQPAGIRDRRGVVAGSGTTCLASGVCPSVGGHTELDRAFNNSPTRSCRDGESRLEDAGDTPRTDRTRKGQSCGRDRQPSPLWYTQAQRRAESTISGKQLLYGSLSCSLHKSSSVPPLGANRILGPRELF